MSESRSSLSQARSYQEIGEFWDAHDLGEFWDQTEAVEFEPDIQSTKTYYPVETGLSEKLRSLAEQRGVSAETLLNLWVQEKTREEATR
jgi:hypothetical protein